ncbi:fungal-specific transcription factor domain-containing protein [Phaeosphaeriaceae sp. PMI808]|nr:fungal-specific transcription factor domain-containing protein [Phaeosphaeriaceae sp. PMI808]
MQRTHRSRPPHSRTRAGCLTCRSRKKKCDEGKPRCAGCRRNMLDCKWPSGVRACNNRYELDPITRIGQHTSGGIYQPLATIPVSSDSACGLTPHSMMFLRHYLRYTVPCFAMTPMKDNPFATLLLPLGYLDDLLMHSLLAFGGAHLSHKIPNSSEIATATTLHYSRMIKGLQLEFAQLNGNDLQKKERLLRILLVVCHYEVVSGDVQGAMFNHLRASRQLVLSFLDSELPSNIVDTTSLNTLGSSIEMYLYLIFTNSITPYGVAAERSLPFDMFVISGASSVIFPEFGALFAGSHEICKLIPEVSLLASRRLAEEVVSPIHATAALCYTHNDIYDRVASWTLPPSRHTDCLALLEQRWHMGNSFRQGLYIYLATALAGSVLSDPVVKQVIQGHIDELFSYAPQILASEYIGNVLWPFVIAGTCMVIPQQQQMFLSATQSSRFDMKHITILGDTLQLLWADSDPRAYGPYGLHLVMKKYRILLGLA